MYYFEHAIVGRYLARHNATLHERSMADRGLDSCLGVEAELRRCTQASPEEATQKPQRHEDGRGVSGAGSGVVAAGLMDTVDTTRLRSSRRACCCCRCCWRTELALRQLLA